MRDAILSEPLFQRSTEKTVPSPGDSDLSSPGLEQQQQQQ